MEESRLLLQHSFGKGFATLDVLDFGDVGFLFPLCQLLENWNWTTGGLGGDVRSQASLPPLLASYRRANET